MLLQQLVAADSIMTSSLAAGSHARPASRTVEAELHDRASHQRRSSTEAGATATGTGASGSRSGVTHSRSFGASFTLLMEDYDLRRPGFALIDVAGNADFAEAAAELAVPQYPPHHLLSAPVDSATEEVDVLGAGDAATRQWVCPHTICAHRSVSDKKALRHARAHDDNVFEGRDCDRGSITAPAPKQQRRSDLHSAAGGAGGSGSGAGGSIPGLPLPRYLSKVPPHAVRHGADVPGMPGHIFLRVPSPYIYRFKPFRFVPSEEHMLVAPKPRTGAVGANSTSIAGAHAAAASSSGGERQVSGDQLAYCIERAGNATTRLWCCMHCGTMTKADGDARRHLRHHSRSSAGSAGGRVAGSHDGAASEGKATGRSRLLSRLRQTTAMVTQAAPAMRATPAIPAVMPPAGERERALAATRTMKAASAMPVVMLASRLAHWPACSATAHGGSSWIPSVTCPAPARSLCT